MFEVKVNVPDLNAGIQIIQKDDGEVITFIHNPRTGGSSVNAWMYDNKKPEWTSIKYNSHISLHVAKTLMSGNERIDLGTTVSTVRHPYMRYLSLWNYVNRNLEAKKRRSFSSWWTGNTDQIKAVKHHKQSVYWKGCDIVMLYEDLNNEVSVKLKPLMETTNGLDNYRYNYYNVDYGIADALEIIPKKFRDEIKEIDKETFEEFGYDQYD